VEREKKSKMTASNKFMEENLFRQLCADIHCASLIYLWSFGHLDAAEEQGTSHRDGKRDRDTHPDGIRDR
jgi:hypothetical protein